MSTFIALSQELRRLRKERDLSQEQLADRVDLTQATLSRYEGGKRQPSVSTLAKLAPALGATTMDFASGHLSSPAAESEEDDARLRRLCQDAIRLAQAGVDLPPLPMFRQEAKRLGLDGWTLLRDGESGEVV